MSAPIRPPSGRCEVCGCPTASDFGFGFPCGPATNPGLPDHLRGSVIWLCGWNACREAARARALRAARAAGVAAPTLCDVLHFPPPKN